MGCRIVTVTEMKPIGGKMRQRVTVFVDDWNIHRSQDSAQKARSTRDSRPSSSGHRHMDLLDPWCLG